MTHATLALLFIAAGASKAAPPKKPAPKPPEDHDPPSIIHTPIREANYDTELRFEADISDASGVFDPVVAWRKAGSLTWERLTLNKQAGESYVAALSSYQVRSDLDYFIEAYDTQGNGPVKFGSPERPLRIKCLGAPAAPAPPGASAPPPPPAPPKKEEPSGPLPLGPIVVSGAGVVAAAIGAILYMGASGDVDELNSRYAVGALMNQTDHDKAVGALGRARLGSIVATLGAVAIAGGAAWFFAPSFLADGAALTLGGSF